MFINELHLLNFRNHKSFSLRDAGHTNFIVGPNGSGKTSVLEAISLLTTGKGFRNAALGDISYKRSKDGQRDKAQGSWAVRLSFTDYDFTITTSVNDNNIEKKLMKCNGAVITSRHELVDELEVVWLTPEMIQQFFLSASARRDFFDTLANDIFPGHEKLIRNYRHHNASRLKLLRDTPQSHRWIETLEWQMMELAEQIHMNRNQLLIILSEKIANFDWEFRPEMAFTPKHFYNAQEFCRQQYMFHVKQSRPKDAIVGRATFGVNIDDFELRHNIRGVESKNCSSGEKQGMLIRIFLAHITHLAAGGKRVITLLDDIFAHLDQDNIALLSNSINKMPQVQTWITLTDKDLHNIQQQALIERAQIFNLKENSSQN